MNRLYRCKGCGRRFNARSGTPMAGLRTPLAIVEMSLKARHEGLGLRAVGRVVGKSLNQITTWETRLSDQFGERVSGVFCRSVKIGVTGDRR